MSSIAGQHANLHKQSHFGDVHQKWRQVIFMGMSNILKAINPQDEWL